jgi:hypothetical protein
MLTQYKNIKQIQLASGSISAERLSKNKTEFISFDADESVYYNVDILSRTNNSRIELHVYSNETWITGNHKVQLESKLPEYRNKTTNRVIQWPVQPVAINIYNEFDKLKLTSGTFRIVVNFFKNLIGSYELPHLRIEEISSDRTEVKLRAIDENNPEFLQQITNFIQRVSTKQTSSKTKFYTSYLLNFSRNKCFSFVNSVVIGEYVYVKLLDPLPTDISVDFKCWIVEEQKDPYIDSVAIAKQPVSKKVNRLANPNWLASDSTGLSSETDFKTWSELLGSSAQTSQQIVDSYFSGSLSGIELNIDYSDFNNFVFYSSAEERLRNFKYKLELLEYYSSQSAAISEISGSVAELNSIEYNNYKTNLISGFDNFEKYLYYQSESKYTTYTLPSELQNPPVPTLTGSYIMPAPKSTSSLPYTLYPVSSSQFQTWYNGLIDSASYYDSFNINALEYALPEYIRFDSTQQQAVTFTRMLGQHYDVLYSYIKHVTQIYKREENPKLGMPNEMLYSVAKQFGWNLIDGNQQQDLWVHLFGTDEQGTPQTGSNSINGTSMPGKERTYTIWRRIVNNLPFLLKSKGTKRSVQALLACYGIPQSIISINEYGGPRLERAPVYEKLNFDYALDLLGNISGSVTVNYNNLPLNAVELRFRTDNVQDNPFITNSMQLISIGGNIVTLDFQSGDKGVFTINGGNSTQPISVYDGEWASLLMRNNSNGGDLDIVVKKSKYGKIIAAVSASQPGCAFSPYGSDSAVLGGSAFFGSRWLGQLQELRFWSSSLNDSAFNNHVKAPAAYDGNVDAYDELLFRLPLTQKINHALTSSLIGVQPMSSSISASFNNWTNVEPYDSIEETYYYDAISLGAGTFDDNKVRIESSDLIGTLDVKTRAERSQYDKAPLDSKKLGVYFSPQTMIDEDIISQLGYTNLDEYIGDPGLVEDKSYPELIRVAQNYWRKYEQRNDINSYIKIFTLFDLSFFKQLNQVLPARVDKTTGVLIQPNILERSKDTILPTIKRFDSTYGVVLDEFNPVTTGESLDYFTIIDTAPNLISNTLQYDALIDDDLYTITAQDDDQWQMYLTASTADKYDGVAYSYEYLILSGSKYITSSSPYWLSEALCPAITASIVSEFAQYKFYISSSTTASYKPARTTDYFPQGIDNQRYSGTKIKSPAFNVNSTQTYDGGPVVEWRSANPNQLIYQKPGEQGSFRLT